MPLQPQNFLAIFALAVAWVALVIGASIVYRLSKGKPLFRPHFEHPLFLETWRSGYSFRSVITRLGAARNCLWVAVNENALWVAPHFPFNLMFLPEISGLEYAIPGSAIRTVERADGLLAGIRVRVSVECRSGVESFEVSLRDPDAFVRAVESIRRAK